jgi:hypothetical protein
VRKRDRKKKDKYLGKKQADEKGKKERKEEEKR